MKYLVLTMATLLMAAGAGTAWHYYRKHHDAQRNASRLHDHAQKLTQQLRSAELYVGQLVDTVIPAIGAAVHNGHGHQAEAALPPQLTNTPLADHLRALADQLGTCIAQVGQQAHAASAQQVAQLRLEVERRVAQARHEAVDVSRAAVRAFASSTVQRASKLSTTISAGVRRHVSDEAYATLVEIDHLAQQMLLTASGFAVLSGDKLSRRWPATTLTDIVRTAMGRIEGYERVQHPKMDHVAVEGRAVEAVVHTLAVLLDNALRYSPPAAHVHVSLEQGHRAAFLIVDDAGLRMDDERLIWARDVMAGEQRDDITQLGAYPQTGLRVASLLAENYGFQVELTVPNIYQGTRAVIVLPPTLLTEPVSVPTASVQMPAEGATAEPQPEAVATSTTTANGLTVRQHTVRPAASSRVLAPEPVEPGSPGVAAAWVEGTRRGRASQSNSLTNQGR
ncbi:ATP-binding protein [Streptomyces sp. NPDC088921]|uniref:ATP-binding protein n=1 Tax=unclassified Streptomyces TaxID=2593676 RepID=UPI0034490841